MPNTAVAIERRKRLIEYYETVANRNKYLACQQFRNEIKKSTIYHIIRTHEKRKKDGFWKRKYAGGKRTVVTPENLKKLEELYRMDPNVTAAEACQILNISARSSLYQLKKFYEQVKSGSISISSLNDEGESIIEYPNAWSANTDDAEETVSGNSYGAHFGDSDSHEFPISHGGSDNDENEKKVVVDPKQKPKKLRKTKLKASQNTQRCLACFESFEFETGNELNTSSSLQDNLNMVFVFKSLLGLSSEELVDIMKISKGANPNKWANFCSKCRGLVEEAAAIPRKMRELEERLTECGEQLTGSIKSTWSYKARSICVNEKLYVTRRVRDIVKKRRPSKRTRKTNPFDEGDKQAESLLPPPPVVVKQEAEDLIDTDISFEPGSSSFLDMEDSLGVPDILKTKEKETGFCSSTSISCHSSITNPENDVPIHFLKINEGVGMQEIQGESMESTPASGNISANVSEPIAIASDSIIDIDPTPLPTSTQGICDSCGMEMRPLAIPSHKLNVHGVIMEGFTVKYCTKQGCDFKTLYNMKLKNHMKKHELKLNRPFCCSWCSMRFITRRDMIQHEEIHKNADSRPYVCDICGSSFAVKNYLYLHKRLSHEKRYFPSTKRKKSNQTQGSSGPGSIGDDTSQRTSNT